MNQTEAWETVLQAADIFCRLNLTEGGKKAVFVTMDEGDPRNLVAALRKVSPRVERMRSRLDFARARKAGTLNRPKWATP